jgi:hypothetical protein
MSERLDYSHRVLLDRRREKRRQPRPVKEVVRQFLRCLSIPRFRSHRRPQYRVRATA